MYRKDFTQLSISELSKLGEAFNSLWNDGLINAYANLHQQYFNNGIHWGPAFLPWHRYFLREVEKALQEFDQSVTLPYWDWTRADSRNLDSEPWKAFFGGRPLNQGRQGEIPGGKFHHWELERLPRPSGTLPVLDEVISELRPETYFEFRAIEYGSHPLAHIWTGGHMASDRSPLDPLFYLHHCNLDRLWAIWQQNHPTARQYSTAMGHRRDRRNGNADVALNTPMIAVPPNNVGATPANMLSHTNLNYRYERDILLEIAWHKKKYGTLLTGDARSSDLYVRDSANDTGEYPSPDLYWRSPDIWVRNNPPDTSEENPNNGHEAPIVNAENYMYVRVNNRGDRTNNVSVEAFHCDPGTSVLWPDNFHSIGTLNHPGDIERGANATLGPFNWTPSVVDHECLLAVAMSPDDPATTRMFPQAIPHSQLVRFDNNVSLRNVSPIRIITGGRARSSIIMRGGVQRSVNDFELDAQALPDDTKLHLRVAKSVLNGAELTELELEEEITRDGRFAALKMKGGRKAVIKGFELPARARKSVRLEIDFSFQAEHEKRYSLVASQIQDGELAGKLTIEFTAIKDSKDYYYGNPRSRELHKFKCKHFWRTLRSNRLPFQTVDEAIARGYNGCRFCLPEYDTDRDT